MLSRDQLLQFSAAFTVEASKLHKEASTAARHGLIQTFEHSLLLAGMCEVLGHVTRNVALGPDAQEETCSPTPSSSASA